MYEYLISNIILRKKNISATEKKALPLCIKHTNSKHTKQISTCSSSRAQANITTLVPVRCLLPRPETICLLHNSKSAKSLERHPGAPLYLRTSRAEQRGGHSCMTFSSFANARDIMSAPLPPNHQASICCYFSVRRWGWDDCRLVGTARRASQAIVGIVSHPRKHTPAAHPRQQTSPSSACCSFYHLCSCAFILIFGRPRYSMCIIGCIHSSH